MAMVVTWSVDAASPFSKVLVERALSFGGLYTLLSEVDYASGRYDDSTGTDAHFYRLTGRDGATGLLASPGLGKQRMVLDLCQIYGYVRLPNGTSVGGVAVRFTPNIPPIEDPLQRAYLQIEPITALTGPDGYFTVSLVQNSTVVVNCPEAGILKRRLVVPNSPNADFALQTLA